MNTSDARILVVDDAPTIRRFLELLLVEVGYAVDLAETADEAMARILAADYELVIVDKNLEGQDGFAVCRAARDKQPNTACMLVTADQSVASAARAVDEQISAYLLKPLRREPVLRKVRQALDRVLLVREREEARAELQTAKETLERRSTALQHTLDQLVETQHRLTESEKQVSLGMLAAGVAHEINNPACFILPNLDYLKRSLERLAKQAREAGADDSDVEEEHERADRMVDRCLEGVNRIVAVVQTLQLFSRRDSGDRSPVDLAGLCRSLLDLVTHELDGQAQLEIDLQPVRPMMGNPQQLSQAVLDLMLNARRSVMSAAREGAHSISLTTSMVDDKIVLIVGDSGPPLAAKGEHSAAFEPFYGGGSLTEGPGLHLTLAREVIDRHGGELTLSSTAQGNRLQATLPPAPEGVHVAVVDKPGD